MNTKIILSEKNYITDELEISTIIKSFKKFRIYLLDISLEIIINYKAFIK